MFGFGKKKNSLDDLGFSDDENFGGFNQNNSNQINDNTKNYGANNSMFADDPLSDNFLDDSSNNSMHKSNFGMHNQDMSSQKPFHPSEFNSSAPDSVVPMAPSIALDENRFNNTGINSQHLNNNQSTSNYHQMELVSSKLDVLKAMIENLSQRVSSLESKIDSEKNNLRKGW